MVVFVSKCLIRSGLVPLLLSFSVMGDMLNATALGAGSSVLGSALGMIGAKVSSNLQQKNWEKQFNMVNEYNSPRAQLARLYDAGINPLFNSDFSGNSAASISASAPGITPNSPNFVEDYQRMRQATFDKSLEDIQTEFWKYKAENEKQQARKTGAEADVIPIRNEKEMQEIEAQTKVLLSTKDKTEEQIKEIRANIQNMSVYQGIEKDKLSLLYRSFRLDKQKFAFEKNARKFANDTDRINAQSNAMNARTNRLSYNLAQDRFEELDKKKFAFEKEIQNKMVKNKEEELRQKAKELSDKEFSDFIDKATSSVMGVKFTNTNDITALWTLYESLGNTLESGEKMSDEKALAINHACDVLNKAIRQNIANQAKSDLKGFADGVYNSLQNSDDAFKAKWGLQKGKFSNWKDRPFFPTGQ